MSESLSSPGPRYRTAGPLRLATAVFALAVFLPSTSLYAQERTGTAPDTILLVRSDSTLAADSLRQGLPHRPGWPIPPDVFLRPPPDTRAPWPFGPKSKYANMGALIGGGIGVLDGLVTDKSIVLCAFLYGVLGYTVGIFFD